MSPKMAKAVQKIKETFSSGDVMRLRALSNKLMETAAIENNKLLAETAMMGYSLHKLSTKSHIISNEKWRRVKKKVVSSLERATEALETNNRIEFERRLEGIVKEINGIDAKLGNFARSIHEKAKVKYASSAYSIGLSLSQATALTGAEKKDVLDYIGATRISDRERSELSIAQRMKKLRELL